MNTQVYPLELIRLIETHPDRAYYRDQFLSGEGFRGGHITASLLIINPERTHILLQKHRIFDRWMQFGGHCDGDKDLRANALRECMEESGLVSPPVVFPEIFDIDIPEIAENPQKGEPAHHHYDILFLGEISRNIEFHPDEKETK